MLQGGWYGVGRTEEAGGGRAVCSELQNGKRG